MPRLLTDDEKEILAGLQSKIRGYFRRNKIRSAYAEAEGTLRHYGVRLSDGKEIEQTPMFWPAKAEEVLSSRLRPAFYTGVSDAELMNQLRGAWVDSTIDFAEQLAIKSALRHGPAFVFASKGDTAADEPEVVVSVSSALSATVDMDRRTRVVRSALELLDDRRMNLYLPGRVLLIEPTSHGRFVVMDEWKASPRVLCAPYVHNATVEKPMGSSRITRPVMGFTDAAVRTFVRSEISAEFYSYPREKWMGVDPDAFKDAPGWLKAIGGIDMMPDVHPDDEPNIPDSLRRAAVSYAPQMTMQPFSDQFRLIAAQFSGASSIPLQYLGIVQDSNPTSAQAIEAQDIDLVRAAEDQQPSFNLGRRMLALNVLTVLTGGEIDPRDLRGLAPLWHDARVRSPLVQGQFVAQQVQVGNLQPGTEETLKLLPIPPETVAAIVAENRRAAGSNLLDRVLSGRPAAALNSSEDTVEAAGAESPEQQ